MTYNIVEVVPGKYAIRRRTFFEELFDVDGEFLDICVRSGNYWWGKGSEHFEDCLTDSIESLRPKLSILKTKPKVIA